MSLENKENQISLEDSMKDFISKKLQDGTIEKIVEEQLTSGVNKALESLFGSYGDLTEIIKDRLKSTMIPYLENYDYSKYLVKLDSVLTDIIKNSPALENKKMLENFKKLSIPIEKKEITVSELFGIWKEYVSENIETYDREVCYEDEVHYKPADVSLEVEYQEERSWSSFEYATLVFECEENKDLNFIISLNKWNRNDVWDMHYDRKCEISSLRFLNDFEILLMQLDQNRTKIKIDTDYEEDEVIPKDEPELSYN